MGHDDDIRERLYELGEVTAEEGRAISRGLGRQCRDCGRLVDGETPGDELSPSGRCMRCVARRIVDDPHTPALAEAAALFFADAQPRMAEFSRTAVAVLILDAYLARCRPRRRRRWSGP
jgi:hypothetical protein